jgi:hypothetical protein
MVMHSPHVTLLYAPEGKDYGTADGVEN